MDEKPVKVDKWDSCALKNALDDGAKQVVVDKLGYHESHNLMDGRLLICSIAVGFAMFALIWDYFHPFPLSRNVLMLCVISYFLLMGVLTAYLTFVEKGIFLVAEEKDRAMMDPDNIWRLSSTLRKYDDTYTLTVSYVDGKTKLERSMSISKCVANYFDENGTFCYELFEPVVISMCTNLASSKKMQ